MANAVWVGGPRDGEEIVLPTEGTRDIVTIESARDLGMVYGKAPVRPRKPNHTSNAKYGIYWNERHK